MKKKIIVFLLVLSVFIAFAACKNKDKKSPENSFKTENVYSETYLKDGNLSDDVQGYILEDIADYPVAVIPDTYNSLPIVAIAAGAFEFSSVTEVTLGANITLVQNGVFRYCRLLKTVKLGKSVKTVEPLAFEGSSALEKIIVSEENTDLSSDGLIVMDKQLGKIEFVPKHIEGTLKLPQNLTEVSDNAFSGCNLLTEVSFGENIVKIGKRAFSGCDKLQKINFGGLSKLKIIDGSAFYNCGSLKTVTFPTGLERVNEQAFDRCSALETVNFGNSVEHISATAFDNCDALKTFSLTANDNYSCESGIIYNAKKSEIEFVPKALVGEITLPYSLTQVKGLSFKDCKNVTMVTVGSNVTFIGNGAFVGCMSMNKLVLNCKNVPAIENKSIAVKNDLRIIVPTALLGLYKNSLQWADYTEFIFSA